MTQFIVPGVSLPRCRGVYAIKQQFVISVQLSRGSEAIRRVIVTENDARDESSLPRSGAPTKHTLRERARYLEEDGASLKSRRFERAAARTRISGSVNICR